MSGRACNTLYTEDRNRAAESWWMYAYAYSLAYIVYTAAAVAAEYQRSILVVAFFRVDGGASPVPRRAWFSTRPKVVDIQV